MDKLSLDGKVAIVTGASSGLGAAIAVLLARRGASLTLNGRNEKNLENTKLECLKAAAGLSDDKILLVPGDLTSDQTRGSIVNNTIKRFGQLDILVNNAGIVEGHRTQDESSLEVFDRIMEVNVRSVIRLTQLAIPHLKPTKGNVVNISSVAGVIATEKSGFYNVSKASLDQYTKCLAVELARDGVRVNSVNPGAIDTPIFSRMYNTEAEKEEVMKALGEVHPMGRVGVPSEVAEAVAFLASDAASFTTGNLLMVDGGRYLFVPKPKSF